LVDAYERVVTNAVKRCLLYTILLVPICQFHISSVQFGSIKHVALYVPLGSAVAQHPAASNPRVLKHSIELAVTVNSVSLTSTCLDRYKRALAADLKDLSRQINEMICNGSMCSYLTGAPGTGVRVNQSAVLSNHYVFAAIDTASLTDAVNFTVCQTRSPAVARIADVLVVSDLQGRLRSIIFIPSERAYATSC